MTTEKAIALTTDLCWQSDVFAFPLLKNPCLPPFCGACRPHGQITLLPAMALSLPPSHPLERLQTLSLSNVDLFSFDYDHGGQVISLDFCEVRKIYHKVIKSKT